MDLEALAGFSWPGEVISARFHRLKPRFRRPGCRFPDRLLDRIILGEMTFVGAVALIHCA